MRRKFLEPRIVIMQQPVFSIIYENGSGDVHCVDQANPLLNAAFAHQILDGLRDIHKPTPMWNLKPQMFGQAFHEMVMPVRSGAGNQSESNRIVDARK